MNKLVMDILLPMYFFARIGISFNIHSIPTFLFTILNCTLYFGICYFATVIFHKVIKCPDGFKNISKGLIMIGNYIVIPIIIGSSECKPYGVLGEN